MARTTAIAILLLAAILEAGGDALMRAGLHRNLIWQRALLFALAALVLFAYGWTVNTPPWDFGKLLGIYVVFFFLVAQLISWLVFKQTPSLAIAIGGLLIVAGGLVISVART
jgi:small multidrug resistance family-3 protein